MMFFKICVRGCVRLFALFHSSSFIFSLYLLLCILFGLLTFFVSYNFKFSIIKNHIIGPQSNSLPNAIIKQLICSVRVSYQALIPLHLHTHQSSPFNSFFITSSLTPSIHLCLGLSFAFTIHLPPPYVVFFLSHVHTTV